MFGDDVNRSATKVTPSSTYQVINFIPPFDHSLRVSLQSASRRSDPLPTLSSHAMIEYANGFVCRFDEFESILINLVWQMP
jgi:hypothetical protein